MASPPVVAEHAIVTDTSAAKLPLMSLIIAMVVAVLLCVALIGGAMFYLVHSGKLSVGRPGVAEGKTEPPAVLPAHVMIFDPMVANLADTGGAAYLKISLAIRIADDVSKKGAQVKEDKPGKGTSDTEAAVRDTVLTVIGLMTSDQLLAPEGKSRLKAALRAALVEHDPDLKVMDLYFVDFLVQR
jgi:flagellar FliL protein